MPELPEVETVRAGLNDYIVGKTVASVTSDTLKSFVASKNDSDAFLLGATIMHIRRRAKALMIDLSTQYSLLVHLKMTGQLVYVDAKNSADRFGAGHPSDSLIGELPDKSTRVIVTFTDGSHLYFNDQRKFGWMKLLPTAEIAHVPFITALGPEPLAPDFTAAQFAERFKNHPKTTIKAALLNQSVVAGVGNIYADESLWGAKIHPSRTVVSITTPEFEALYNEIRAVMTLAIKKGGSSNRTYVNARGEKGKYMDFARVFRREGQPCPRCGTVIEKIRVAGRGTHICPHCQPLLPHNK